MAFLVCVALSCGLGLTGCRYLWFGCESGERGYGYLLEEGVCCADAERDG